MSHDKAQYVPEPEETPDAWHAHSAAEPPPQEEHAAKANPLVLSVVMVSMVVFVVVSCVLVVVYFNRFLTQEKQRKQESTAYFQEFERYRQQNLAAMEGFSWIDRQDGVVRLDINEAMDLVVQEYNGR